MGVLSSQIVAFWVQEELESTSWVMLREVLFKVVRQKLQTSSDEEVWDLVETHLSFVADHLRNSLAESSLDGSVPTFEIDNDPSPYIRLTAPLPSDVLGKLRKIDPFQLEDICAKLLGKLGASSSSTKKTSDGGIDFVAVNLKIVPLALVVPAACKAAVIGQTKRYKAGNPITETLVREFVGAATLRRHQLSVEGKIGPLTPVIFAFWTTSDFDSNAKRYARDLGLWHMSGLTLATYVTDLGLKAELMALPDSPIYGAKPDKPTNDAEVLHTSIV